MKNIIKYTSITIISITAIIIAIAYFRAEYKKHQSEIALNNTILSIKEETKGLQWKTIKVIKGQGNYLEKGISIKGPFRIRYSYLDKENSGMKVYTEKDGKLYSSPLMICTKSENNVSMQYNTLDMVDLKIESKGIWAMSFETIVPAKFPSIELKKQIDSLTTNMVIDSMMVADTLKSFLNKRATLLYKQNKVKYNDLTPMLEKLKVSSLKWHAVLSERGAGDYESMDFYLPASKVRIRAGLYPGSGKSVNGDISLEGKGKRQTWDVVPSCWYMCGYNWTIYTKEVSVPAGYYWINTSNDGYWFYEVSALY